MRGLGVRGMTTGGPTMVDQLYDSVQYPCVAHPDTHVERLHTVGRLFGMMPPDFRRCRVLELGCATGWNVIAMATEYPESEFVGIDLSRPQIEAGERHVANLGLTNVSLRAESILDFSESNGVFDYIICHGVFSWVEAPVRDKILDIARDRLSPNGICLVSYNALPGWGMLLSLRDMMLYHCAGISDSVEKAREARALLNYIVSKESTAPAYYLDMVRSQIALLSELPDEYVLHEYLAPVNYPFYLDEFVAQASQRNLKYLGDSRVAGMQFANLPPETTRTTVKTEDIIRLEQYIDFACNRRFRSTLLCRRDIELRRNIPAEFVDDFHLRGRLASAEHLPEDGMVAERMTFTSLGGGGTVASNDRPTTALLYALARLGGKAVTVETLLAEAASLVSEPEGRELRTKLYGNGLPLFLGGHMDLHSDPGSYVTTVSERPFASLLARYQATFMHRVTTGRHEMINLDPVAQVLLPYLDGTNDAGDLARNLLERVVAGALVLNHGDDGTPVTDSEEQAAAMSGLIEMSLRSLAQCGLLQG